MALGFVVCVAVSVLASYVCLFVAIANMGPVTSMPGHNARSDAAFVAAMIAPIVVFLVGGTKLAPAIRASMPSEGTGVAGIAAFALFPVWAVPIVWFAGNAITTSVNERHRASLPAAAKVGLRLEGATYTDDGKDVTIRMRLRPRIFTERIMEFEINIESVVSPDWQIDRLGPHRGFITAGRGSKSFLYEEKHSHEPLLETDGDSVVVPFVIKRVKPDVHELPTQVVITVNPIDPVYPYGPRFTHTFPLRLQ